MCHKIRTLALQICSSHSLICLLIITFFCNNFFNLLNFVFCFLKTSIELRLFVFFSFFLCTKFFSPLLSIIRINRVQILNSDIITCKLYTFAVRSRSYHSKYYSFFKSVLIIGHLSETVCRPRRCSLFYMFPCLFSSFFNTCFQLI